MARSQIIQGCRGPERSMGITLSAGGATQGFKLDGCWTSFTFKDYCNGWGTCMDKEVRRSCPALTYHGFILSPLLVQEDRHLATSVSIFLKILPIFRYPFGSDSVALLLLS